MNSGQQLSGVMATSRAADRACSELPAARLRRVTQCVRDNLQKELRLAELSALVHMSPYYFARLFKRSTGVPPHHFLVRCRIEQAQALLAARTVPIAEIARLVGFRTPSHFTTAFRRGTGVTPSSYRRGPRTDRRFARPAGLLSSMATAVGRAPASLPQRLEERPPAYDVGGVEPFGEAAVDRCQHLSRLGRSVLSMPEPGQTRGGPQLPGQ